MGSKWSGHRFFKMLSYKKHNFFWTCLGKIGFSIGKFSKNRKVALLQLNQQKERRKAFDRKGNKNHNSRRGWCQESWRRGTAGILYFFARSYPWSLPWGKRKGGELMAFREAKVYSDGSHYIAIPQKEKQPQKKKNVIYSI